MQSFVSLEQVLFFLLRSAAPSSTGQKDAANEILRTEVLGGRLQKKEGALRGDYPDALAEKVVSCKELGDNTLKTACRREGGYELCAIFFGCASESRWVHDEALTPQAIAVQEAEREWWHYIGREIEDGSEFTVRALDFRRLEFGNKPTGTPDASVTFNTSAQPIFIRTFDLVASFF